MRQIIIITFSVVCMAFSSDNAYNYEDTVKLTGVVKEIKYEMPTRDMLTTYILKLDKAIHVNANDEWDTKSNVGEVHLNIMNDKIQIYNNNKISVTGRLFGALNIHHVRDVCIKVDKIEGK